ncbi:DNA polymerase III subunit delta' [Pelagibius marinus]|uniref:DNA polymerase III subunit delta' n=1 Tax=Pelagibius marinus TaxID=2762760 RepID=UPI001872AA47|nr:DNA polymerase III subunit delta' [Pelagibius marinus]
MSKAKDSDKEEAAWPHPRESAVLRGQAAAESVLLRAYASGRLPHAWLLSGPRGVGKATLAYRFARFLMSPEAQGGGLFGDAPESLHVPEDDPVFRRIAASGHSDLMTLEKGCDDKGKPRTVIPVEDVRRLLSFARMTAGEGGWRVAIVDSVDEMNRNAANALLKVLEEPPPRSLLLLVSHAPGSLLPTIRSRCCQLPLAPLSEDVVAELLSGHFPELSPEEQQALARLADGSIGKALALAAHGGLDLYRELIDLLGTLPRLDVPRLHKLAEKWGQGRDPVAFQTGMELLIWWLGRFIRAASTGRPAPEVVPGEAALAQRLLEGRPLAHWLGLWEKISRLFARTEAANLDRKQVVLTAFLDLENAA